MKVSILYSTKYGFTERAARQIAARIRGEIVMVNLDRDRRPDLSSPDVILVGGPIYGGKIRRRISAFCVARMEELLLKKVGLFICCLSTGETAEALLASSFPDRLYAHASVRGILGGELHKGSLSAFDRLLVRSLNVTEDVSRVDEGAIGEMSRAVNAPAGAKK
jgi:menaquinone-dependent protoporphyrinogen oxidase